LYTGAKKPLLDDGMYERHLATMIVLSVLGGDAGYCHIVLYCIAVLH